MKQVIKSLHYMLCVGSEDYTNKKGETVILNHYKNNLGYLIKCIGTEKRTIGEKYAITLTLIDYIDKEKNKTQSHYYSEFVPDDLQQTVEG